MKNLVSAKLGASVATMFFASIVSKARALTPEEIFADDARLTATGDALGGALRCQEGANLQPDAGLPERKH